MSSRCVLIRVIFSDISKDPTRKDHFLKYDNFSQLLDSSATRVLALKARKPAARVKSKSQTEMDCGKASDRCGTTDLVFTVIQVTTKTFTKTCFTKTVCDNSGTAFLKKCKAVEGKTCEF